MNKLILFVLCAICLIKNYEAATEKVVVCYYGTWATYRNGLGKFDVSHIKADLCTHLVYTFVGINSQGNVISLDPYLDLPDNWGRNNFGQFNALKQQNSNLKTLLAVGGWNEGSGKYSIMAANPTFRRNFVNSALAMVQQYGFDGLDMDWEYPNQRDTVFGRADINNFSQLLKELREEFDKYGLLLTAAVSAVRASASQSYDISAIAQNLDFIHVMTYDMYGSWDPTTGHNAPLHRGEGDNGANRDSLNTVDVAVEYWLGQGCPPEKLVLGLPFYGRTFQLANANNNGVKAPASGPGLAGPFTATSGTIGYNEFCQKLRTETWQQRYDTLAKVPYAVQGRNWVSFDDPNSIAIKVEYALQLNLAGAMVWSIETDDFHGICQNEDFPLLRAINRALGKSGVTTTTTVQPSTTTTTTTTTPVPTTTTARPSTTSSTTTTTTTTTTPRPTTTTTPTPTTTTTTQASTTTTAASTSTSTTSAPTVSTTASPDDPFVCTQEGFHMNPKDCRSFYVCIRGLYNKFDAILFNCPADLYWDRTNDFCNYQNEVECDIN